MIRRWQTGEERINVGPISILLGFVAWLATLAAVVFAQLPPRSWAPGACFAGAMFLICIGRVISLERAVRRLEDRLKERGPA
jgi:hypothetical protein